MDTESINMLVPWKIFNRVPNARTIARSLDDLPDSWVLTPVRDKKPYRDGWQEEAPVSRAVVKDLILNGQVAVSKRTGKEYTAFDSGYGLRTGDVSGGLIAIDVDGASAQPILDALSGGELPITVSWTSGKPGRYQLLFQISNEYREQLKDLNRAVITSYKGLETASVIDDKGNKKYTELLELRYNRSQSVLPPSLHPDTGNYSWINSPDDTSVAIAPEWLCNKLVELAAVEREKLQDKEEREFNWANYKSNYQHTGTVNNLSEFLNFEVLPRLSPLQIYNDPSHNFKEVGKDKLVGSPHDRVSTSGTSFQVRYVSLTWLWHDFSKNEGGGPVQYRYMLRGGIGTPTGQDFVEIVKELAAEAGVEIPDFKRTNKYENNSRTNARKSRASGNDTRDDKSTVPGMDDRGHGSGDGKQSTTTGQSQTSRNYENHGFTSKPDLIVNRRYLGEVPLPETGIVGIKAAKGTGKTQSVIKIVHDAISIGRPVILLTHRIMLGRSLCERLGLYWIDEKDESAIPGLHIGLCFDSLWRLNPDDYKNAIIIVDEIEQVIWHELNSSTCKEKRTLLLKLFKQFITTATTSNGLVIGMDADLSQNTLDYLVAMSEQEIKPWVCVNEWKPTPKYFAFSLVLKYYMLNNAIKSGSAISLKYFFTTVMDFKTPKIVMYDFRNPARMIREIESCLEKGEKLYICCDSRDGRYSAKGVAELLSTKFPFLKILRVDSVTSRTPDHPAVGFVDNINSEIIKWDVVICSPSIGSGVSIDVKGHFNKVFGIFNGVIPDWEARQALARVREYIPRHVWTKKQGMGSVYRTARLTDYKQIVQKLTDDFKQNSKFAELMVPSIDVEKVLQGYHDPSHLKAFAFIAAKVNQSMWNYRNSMRQGMSREGYDIEIISDKTLENQLGKTLTILIGMNNSNASYEEMKPLMEQEQKLRKELSVLQEPDKEIVRNLGAASKARKQESYIEISNAPLITKSEFEDLSGKKQRTSKEDYQLEKYSLSQIYSDAEITEPLVKKTKADNYHSKIQRHYFLQAPVEYTKLLDRKQYADQISVGGQIYLPDFKNRTLETEFLSSLNIMQWVNTALEISSQTESLLSWCEELLAKHKDIQLALGINLKPHIPDSDSNERVIEPIKMLQTMLDYIGLHYKCSRRPKTEGSRIRYYKLDIEALEDERTDIFSRWDAKYSELVTKQCASPVTLPWEIDKNGRENIPNGDSCPRNSYRYNKPYQDVDTKPVDTDTDIPTSHWKGIVTRVKSSLTGISVIWRDIYEKLSGTDCTVDTEPYPVQREGRIEWQVWASFASGIYKAIPCTWLECA